MDKRKQNALLDWQNEKKYQTKIVNTKGISPEQKAKAQARIKEADRMISLIKK